MPEYVEILRAADLRAPSLGPRRARRGRGRGAIGRARLIDNAVIELPPCPFPSVAFRP